MIGKDSRRLTLTFSKKQANWLETNAKKCHMTTSKFVKWLIDKNIGHLINQLSDDELQEIIRIAKVQWLDFDDDDDY